MPMPTPIEYVSLFLDEVRGKLGSKADTNEGSRWDAFGGGLAQMFARANRAQTRAFDAHTRERAKGKDLDDYCSKRGPIRRMPAARSRGYATWMRATAAFGAMDLPLAFELRAPYEGRSFVFRTMERVGVAAAATSVSARVEAVLEGSDSNVGLVASGLANVVPAADPLLLPDLLAVSGGTPEETDDELRERQRLYEEAREKGTRAAIALGALMVPGCKKVVIVGYDDSHLGARGAVYVGDRDWNTSQLLIEQVVASLESYRGLGSLQVLGMTNTDVPVDAELEMQRPATAYALESLREAATRNVMAYFDNRGAPYEYSVQSIGGRLERAHDEVLRAIVNTPLTSVVNPLSATSLAISGLPVILPRYRTKPSLITLSIRGAT